MSLRRGFKSEANRISLLLRRKFSLAPYAPMDLKRLAQHLNAIVVPLSEFREENPDAVEQLIRKDPAAFSGMTVPLGEDRYVVVVNDSHDDGRQNASVAHEFSHILLGHKSTLPIDSTGCRNIDRDVEEEANWLGPTLLIPDEAALYILRTAMGTQEACRLYGVSAALLRMRINVSGARIRFTRSIH